MRMLILVAALLLASPAVAERVIRCTAAGKADVVVRLDGKRMLGHRVNCVGGDFVARMTACAPDRSIALSASTPPFALVRILPGYYWQGIDEESGVLMHWATSIEISFDGTSAKDVWENRRSKWRFVVDRISGEALLKVDEKPVETYMCAADKL